MEKEYNECLEQLYDLGYVDYELTDSIYNLNKTNLTKKGIIGSQISNSNEILMTELIVNGYIDTLDVPSLAAVLSIFCNEQKINQNKSKIILPSETTEVITWIINICEECRSYSKFDETIQEQGITDNFSELAYKWATGISYLEMRQYIQEYGNEFGGNFVRNILRITNFCVEVLKK